MFRISVCLIGVNLSDFTVIRRKKKDLTSPALSQTSRDSAHGSPLLESDRTSQVCSCSYLASLHLMYFSLKFCGKTQIHNKTLSTKSRRHIVQISLLWPFDWGPTVTIKQCSIMLASGQPWRMACGHDLRLSACLFRLLLVRDIQHDRFGQENYLPGCS